MSANNIIELLGFCLNKSYFLFQGQFYEQTKWAAMGLPVSPVVANTYTDEFKKTEPSQQQWMHLTSGRYMLMTFCEPTPPTQRRVLEVHQLSRSIHPVHCRRKQAWWFCAFSWYYNNTTSRWNLQHRSIWETHTYWPISVVGLPS